MSQSSSGVEAISGSGAAGRFARSGARFVGFFEELREAFVERDDILEQIALALLGREHVLMTGPPGTAKSQLARAVLGRILDAKTGEPSLFARQFTENTVLTDLVGAIDFKTLMETGRSEHFTDDGIMGSVHAFLDEVFDGRDMLLRSTLNLLGERELKEGKRTTRGRVECSLMTTNRYLVEVLDESRESLLAFVDRIAFVGFVPKGFAHEESMRKVMRQSLGAAQPLRTYLTIQDVDVLQETVDLVRVPPEACDRLVEFLAIFEHEMAAAVRATPDFSPSRYLSTRTRVRAGKLLKSVALYRKLFRDPTRALEITLEDFEALRLVLLQSGPPKALVAQLAKEQDPREARQLKILQTERDVFERSLAKLDRTPLHEPAPTARTLDSAAWNGHSLDELLTGLQTAAPGDPSANALSRLILRRIIEQGLAAHSNSLASLEQTARLHDHVERKRGPVDPLAQWLRGRNLGLIESAIERASLGLEGLSEARRERGVLATLELLSPIVENLLVWAEDARRLCERTPHLTAARVTELFEISAGAVANRLHEALHTEIEGALSDAATRAELVDVAAPRLKSVLEALDAFGARTESIHPAFTVLLEGVARAALAPLTARALAPLARAPRDELIPTFDALWEALTAAHVARYLPLDDVLASALKCAVAQDKAFIQSARQRPAILSFGLEAYHELRKSMPRTPLCYVAIELCLRLDSAAILEFARAPGLDPFAARAGRLPADLRGDLWACDSARIALSVEFFEAWLARSLAAGAADSELFRLLGVLEQEEVGARVRLETELIQAVLPEVAPDGEKLRVRLGELFIAVRGAVQARSSKA
ncbi:MAG: AAA family ATPase [Polyangiaceae bacterium]